MKVLFCGGPYGYRSLELAEPLPPKFLVHNPISVRFMMPIGGVPEREIESVSTYVRVEVIGEPIPFTVLDAPRYVYVIESKVERFLGLIDGEPKWREDT